MQSKIMLIYLDAKIVQYCADYEDFIFGDSTILPVNNPTLRKELLALKKLVELEQFGNWSFAAPHHLLAELHRGKPTENQLEVYRVLQEAWKDSEPQQEFMTNGETVADIESSLVNLNLIDIPDRRHLAEAIALKASWFLTLDNDILEKTCGKVRETRVCRPSESLEEISVGLFPK